MITYTLANHSKFAFTLLLANHPKFAFTLLLDFVNSNNYPKLRASWFLFQLNRKHKKLKSCLPSFNEIVS